MSLFVCRLFMTGSVPHRLFDQVTDTKSEESYLFPIYLWVKRGLG
jgi:hypothetical protein